MKKQINFGLFLLTLFIVWLFTDTYLKYQLTLKKYQQNRYEIYKENEYFSIPPIILDNVTGESWRYFKDKNEKDDIESEGWTLLSYSDYSEFTGEKVKSITPEGIKEKQKHQLRKWIRNLPPPSEKEKNPNEKTPLK